MSETVRHDLDALFAPLEQAEAWVVGQLGQSLDGRIATDTGHSHYVNGPEDIRRLHRLRALADAVVVGAGTAASDDPRLTVREVEGPDPVRVVLDPRGRLPRGLRLFTDGAAPTRVIRGTVSAQAGSDADYGPDVEVWRLESDPRGRLAPHTVVARLRAEGLRRILVEGGGVTVSGFLEAGALDRLHLSVAPVLIGSGRPGITLPPIRTMDQAMRPPVRRFVLGSDLLFDLDLRGGTGPRG